MKNKSRTTKGLRVSLDFFEAKYVHDEGFLFIFTGHTKSGQIHKIEIRFGFCWIGNIADEMWKLIKARERTIEIVKYQLRGQA